MRWKSKLALVATLTFAGVFQASAWPAAQVVANDTVGSVFLRKEVGWVLSSAHPTYPYNREPRLQTMFGAGGETPFACGLTSLRNDYSSGPRGELACVNRSAGGDPYLRVIQGGYYFTRVYDAAPLQAGFAVLALPFGGSQASVILLSNSGDVQGTLTIPGGIPDQAIVLASGRFALLRNEGGTCSWTILERVESRFWIVATVPYGRQGCSISRGSDETLRDQKSGQVYLRSRYPRPNALYRIDDTELRSPATLVTIDFAADVETEATSDASHVMVHDGAVYFNVPTPGGPIIGRYDLAAQSTTRLDLRASSGRRQDADRVYGIAISQTIGPEPKVILMDERVETRMVAIPR